MEASGLGMKQPYTFCLVVAVSRERFCHKVCCSDGSVGGSQVLWNAVLCQLVNFYWYFRGVHCLGQPGSSVDIVNELQAGRSGIESRWGRDFPPVQTGPRAHPASFKMGTGSFPGVKCSRGMLLTTHPLLVPQSWKSRAIPLPTLWATWGL